MIAEVNRCYRGWVVSCRTGKCRYDTINPRDLLSAALDELSAHEIDCHPNIAGSPLLARSSAGLRRLPVLPPSRLPNFTEPLAPRLKRSQRLCNMTALRAYDPQLREIGLLIDQDVRELVSEVRQLRARLEEARGMNLFARGRTDGCH